MAASTYNKGKELALTTDLGTADIRILILAGASVPAGALNKALDTVADVLGVSGAVEAVVAGYSRVALPGKAVAEDDVSDRAQLTWTDIVWTTPASGETWRAAIAYVEGGSDATRELLWYDEFSSGLPTNGQNITYQGGLLRLTDA